MRTQEAIDHFGSQQALAEAIGLTQPTISGWRGEHPPIERQIDIEVATNGKLKADLSPEARRILSRKAVA